MTNLGLRFPDAALTAARLGRPQDAVDALLLDQPHNGHLADGFSNGGSRPFLPASGGLLCAVALMAAGWEPASSQDSAGASAAPQRATPGFPADGSWTVRWEGLQKAP